jgi:SAM-dependent methyltransferase
MMKCIICHSKIKIKRRYDEHDAFLSTKTRLKDLLLLFKGLFLKYLSKNNMILSKSIFKGYIGVCDSCGHGVMEKPPSKEALKKYYSLTYWTHRSDMEIQEKTKDTLWKTDSRAQHQVQFVLDNLSNNKMENILEIGAGAACASLLLRDKSSGVIKLFTCEPGNQWTEYYRRMGINKIAEYFPFITTERFDYVHTCHWLEHVPNLSETLSELKKIINSAGHIFVEVPNAEHDYWDVFMNDTPHIQFFTKKSLVKAFENFKFTCLACGDFGITCRDWVKGVSISTDDFGPHEKGCWIRAIFKNDTNAKELL